MTPARRSIIDPSFLDLSARDRVIVRGADASTYLQSQIAQDIRGLAVGATLRGRSCSSRPARSTRSPRVTRTGDDDVRVRHRRRLRRGCWRRGSVGSRSASPRRSSCSNSPTVAEPAPTNEDARIAAGWPRMGAEIVPGETIPAVTGVTGVAVNFTKGCYPGQELVERMDSRGAEAPLVVAGPDHRVRRAARRRRSGDPVVDASGATDRHRDECRHRRRRWRRSSAATTSAPHRPTSELIRGDRPFRGRDTQHGQNAIAAGRQRDYGVGEAGEHQRVADRGHLGVMAQAGQLG